MCVSMCSASLFLSHFHFVSYVSSYTYKNAAIQLNSEGERVSERKRKKGKRERIGIVRRDTEEENDRRDLRKLVKKVDGGGRTRNQNQENVLVV